MDFLPPLMTFNSGAPVTDAAGMDRRRDELLALLRAYAYGDPIPPVPVTGRTAGTDPHCACGEAVREDIRVTCRMSDTETFTFPMYLYRPAPAARRPVILALNFRARPYDEYLQPETTLRAGFALAVVNYTDLSSDDGDFTDKLAAFFPRTGSGRDAGKLTVWAWGASRALDYLLARPDIEPESAALIGHSRLGKTALWCAAQDERVRFVCSNDSGCMGAAYHRTLHPGGESLERICDTLPYWFCENLRRFKKTPEALPFDQHFLLACVAPRCVCVHSAALDAWADPASEQLSCLAAAPAWTVRGLPGFSGGETPCGENEGYADGNPVYFKRSGAHFLGLPDWTHFVQTIKCVQRKMKDEG